MSALPPETALLPHALPFDSDLRLYLVCIRRMAAHGLQDARASLLMLDRFGLDWRRRLVLLRAFVHELAQTSQRRIRLAPCCAGRMTADEAQIIAVLENATDVPEQAAATLAALTANRAVASPLSLAAMLARPAEW